MKIEFFVKKHLVFILCLVFMHVATGQGGEVSNPIELEFDDSTGQWVGLRVSTKNLIEASEACDVEIETVPGFQAGIDSWKADSIQRKNISNQIEVTIVKHTTKWSVTNIFVVDPVQMRIRRSSRLKWKGQKPVRVKSIKLRIPGVVFDHAKDACWSIPGNFPVNENKIQDAKIHRVTQERGWTWAETGYAYAFSKSQDISLHVGCAFGLDFATVMIEETDGKVCFVHEFQTQANLKPGDEITVGDQWVQVGKAESESFKEAARQLNSVTMPGPPLDRPDWLDGAVLYSMHPWGRLESWWDGDKGRRLADSENQLEAIKKLGVTSIWLLSLTNKPPYIYSFPSFKSISPDVATPQQLKSFIGTAHQHGIRVLMDMVTYGIQPESPDVGLLPPDVWCRDLSGKKRLVWGGSVLAADLMNPAYREQIVKLGQYWVGNFANDGFRLDCGGKGQIPNWKSSSGARANASMHAGGVGQNGLLRTAIRKINPDAVLFPESCSPINFKTADLIYDYPLYMACREMTGYSDLKTWVEDIRDWLDAQQLIYSYRQQQSLVHFMENHDTAASQDRFGVGPSQVLTGLSAFIPGVCMLYQNQETGYSTELGQWLKLRQTLPELRLGKADFSCVLSSDPYVLSFLRYTDDSACVIACNFSGEESTCRLMWPQDIATRFPVCQDVFTDEIIKRGDTVRIAPYRFCVLTLRKERRSEKSAKQESRKQAKGGGSFEQTIQRMEGNRDRHIITMKNMDSWFVLTAEGLLCDNLKDQKKKIVGQELPLCLKRCWHPFEYGLWDGPFKVNFGAFNANGTAIEIAVLDKKNIKNAQINIGEIDNQIQFIIDSVSGTKPFTVIRHDRSSVFLEKLRTETRQRSYKNVSLDSQRINIHNKYYDFSLTRKMGGGLYNFQAKQGGRGASEDFSCIVGDKGLFDGNEGWGWFGKPVTNYWDTNPCVNLSSSKGSLDDINTIEICGKLRRPSWNLIQYGLVAQPVMTYRQTYKIDDSSQVHYTLGIQSTVARTCTDAYLAYCIPFRNIRECIVNSGDFSMHKTVGNDGGDEIFNLKKTDAEVGAIEITLLSHDNKKIQLKSFAVSPNISANIILADKPGPIKSFRPSLQENSQGALQLYLVLFDSIELSLEPEEESVIECVFDYE